MLPVCFLKYQDDLNECATNQYSLRICRICREATVMTLRAVRDATEKERAKILREFSYSGTAGKKNQPGAETINLPPPVLLFP